jgi:CHASE2 domain-containing sensor protein
LDLILWDQAGVVFNSGSSDYKFAALPNGAIRMGNDRFRVSMRERGVLQGFLFAILLSYLFHWFALDFPTALRFEHQLADWRTGFLSDRRPSQHPEIAVVLVDDSTLKNFPYTSPVDRGLSAKLLQRIDAAGAKAIALDFIYQHATEPEKDQVLLAAIRDAKAKVILGAADERTFAFSTDDHEYQQKFLALTGRQAGYLNLDADADEVVRHRLGPSPGGAFQQSFASLIAAADGKAGSAGADRIAWLRRPADNADTFFTAKAETILGNGAVSSAMREQLNGRLVLVGGAFPDRDLHRTPLFNEDGEGGRGTIHGVFLHAQILAQILDGRIVRELPGWPTVFLVSFFGFILGRHFYRRGFSLVSGSVSAAALIGLDLLLFWQFRAVVPYLAASCAWLVGGVCGYRSIPLENWFRERLGSQSNGSVGQSSL